MRVVVGTLNSFWPFQLCVPLDGGVNTLDAPGIESPLLLELKILGLHCVFRNMKCHFLTK